MLILLGFRDFMKLEQNHFLHDFHIVLKKWQQIGNKWHFSTKKMATNFGKNGNKKIVHEASKIKGFRQNSVQTKKERIFMSSLFSCFI